MEDYEIAAINKTRKPADRIIMTPHGPFDPVYDRHRVEDGGGRMAEGYEYNEEGAVVKKGKGVTIKLIATLAKVALFFARR